MKIKTVLLWSVFVLLFFSVKIGLSGESFSLLSSDLSATVKIVEIPGGQKALLTELLDRVDKTSFLKPNVPFFVLPVRKEGSKNPVWISSQSTWKKVAFGRPSPDVFELVFKDPKELAESSTMSVTIRFRCSETKPGLYLSWLGSISDKRYSYTEGYFPKLIFQPIGAKNQGITPMLSGEVHENVFSDSFRYGGNYPNGFAAPMPWFAYWNEESKKGLFFAALDPDGNSKKFTWKGHTQTKEADFLCAMPFENMCQPGNSFTGYGEFCLRTFKGDWYDAALIYRDWVRKNAKWYPKMTASGRPDIPQWMKENCVFLMASSDSRWLTPNRRVYTPLDKMAERLHAFRDAVGVPGAVHWYLWHQNPYDNDYPHFFPAKTGFADQVLKVQKDNDFRVMPYTNGRLWDTHDRGAEDWKFTKEGLAGAIKKEDGSIWTETYALKHTGREADGTPCVHAIMCPGSDVWAKQIRQNVLTAMNGHNVQGVYIDQVGAATVCPCFDKTHRHAPGGGHWWLEKGYWKIFTKIREDMRREVPDFPLNPELKKLVEKDPQILKNRIIATECNAEVYTFCVDGFLVWHWQSPIQVPAFPVIYGGVVPMFGRTSTGDALSVKMRVCEALVFGEQIGWFDPSVKDDPEKFPFIRDAIRLRYQIRDFFYKGEMARTPKFIEAMPKTSADWLWGERPNRNTKDSVRTSVWRILDFDKKIKGIEELKSAVVIFSNVSNERLTNRIAIDKKELGLSGKKFHLYRIDSDGHQTNLPVTALDETIVFPPQKSFALKIVLD